MEFLRAFTPILLDLVATLVFVVTYWLTDDVALGDSGRCRGGDCPLRRH